MSDRDHRGLVAAGLAATAVIVALVAAVGGLRSSTQPEPTEPNEPVTSSAPTAEDGAGVGWRWPVGVATLYDLEWRHGGSARAQQLGETGEDNVVGGILLRGELEVVPIEREAEGSVLLAVSLPVVEHLAWRAMGAEIPAEDAIARYFAGRTAYVRLDPAGAPVDLRFPADTPRPFGQVMTALVHQALPRPPAEGPAERWTTVAETGLGVAETTWRVSERVDVGTFTLEAVREAAGYREQRLARGVPSDGLVGQGRASFRVVNGRLEHVSGQEHLEVRDGAERVAMADVSVRLDYARSEPREAARRPGELVALEGLADDARKDALDKRVHGMTFERLAADLRQFGAGGVMPRHKAWLWQVTGWLKRYPERTAELAGVFWDARVGERGQALILDLLASVGHPQAQALMRELLDDARVVGRADYVANLQRLTLLSEPEADTVALAARRYAEHGGDVGRAAAVTLGAMAARGAAGGEGIVRGLVADLDGAASVDEERALLRALGASRSPLAEPAVAARLGDSRAVIRAEAARALAFWDDPEARELLAGAVARERDPVGQKWALAALARQEPSATGLDALTTLLQRGGLDRTNVYEALGLVDKAADSLGAAAVWPTAVALRDARVGDRAARSRIQSLVERLRAQL